MNRRSLLRGLLALPLAPLAARALPEPRVIWSWYANRSVGLTLLDVARRSTNPILPVVEALSQRNRLLEDMVWHEGDLEPGHRVTMGGPYPQVTFRRIS